MQTDSVLETVRALTRAQAAHTQIEELIYLTFLSVGQMIGTFYPFLIILINFEFFVAVLDLRVT